MELRSLIVFSLFLVSNCGSQDGCQYVQYSDVLLKSATYSKSKLKLNLGEWQISGLPLLHKRLPIENERRNFIRKVKGAIFSIVYPTPFQSKPVLAAFAGDVLTNILDMDPDIARTRDFVLIASGGAVPRGPEPMAHRYGGHQFGSWADQLGDGRAHLLGEYINSRGERWELQLKGSGLTPYSRSGDGRAVIRSSVREFLCSEAMHHLGIPTSRAATLTVSDDLIVRDQFYNGRHRKERAAVVLRLAPSWFRFGSFEILARDGEVDLLRTLSDFVIEHHFPHMDRENVDKYLMLFDAVVEKTARLIAMWQSVGFVHGVMNTDNFSILSITIDYGPFGFIDEYNPEMVPNTSDDESRYSYENQPDVGYFNLAKLAEALSHLVERDRRLLFRHILNGYSDRYKTEFMSILRKKLGLHEKSHEDEQLVALLLKMMQETQSDFTMTFRHLGECDLQSIVGDKIDAEFWSLRALTTHKDFMDWIERYSQRLMTEGQTDSGRRQLMNSVNPRYVLRNWITQEVIEMVEADDFDRLNKAMDILRHPYTRQQAAEDLGYASPPPSWASRIKVSCSS